MKRYLFALVFFLFSSALFFNTIAEGNRPPARRLADLSASDYRKEIRNERARFENQQRSYPFKSYPVGKRFGTLIEVLNMKFAVNMNDLPVWQAIGPGNVGGRLNAIAVDPIDDNTLYVGGVSSGVWKTINGGNSWTPLTDDLPSLSIGALAVDPLNGDIVYAGTGEENFIGQYGCKPYRSDQYPGAGVFKSIDGGDNWTQAGEFFSESMCRIAIHPLGTDTLFVSSVDGLYRSSDGGDNWQVLIPGVSTDVLIDPDTPSLMYCVMGKPDGDPTNGIYRSTDGGRNWDRLTTGLPDPTQMGRVMLALAPSSPGNQTIYANISYIYDPLGVYKTTDAGDTWTNTGFDGVGDCYKNATIADPLDELTAYTGGLNLYKTTNGGISWTRITQWSEEIYPYDNQLMVWGNDLTTLFNVSDRGVFKTTDGGDTWIDLDNGLEVTQFVSVALHPTERLITIGGTQDRGTQLYTGDPQGWEQIYPADGGVTIIDYEIPTTFFTEYVYLALLKSTNEGEDWEDATNGINYDDDVGFYAPYVMDPNNHLKMYAGTDRVYESDDGADFWNAISVDLTKNIGFYESYLSAIAVSGVDPEVLYAGTSDGNFHTSMDGGGSWIPTNTGLPNRFVMDIAIDPDDAMHVYTCFSGYDTTHVWESADYGMTWTDISSNLPDVPVNSIVLPTGRFKNPGTIYIGTDFSCFKTTDNGTSWFLFNNELPNTVIEDMAFHETLGFLRVATQGRSVFEVVDTLTTSITVEDNPPVPRGFSLDQNYPNPFNPVTTISYTLASDGKVDLNVYNLKGQKVAHLEQRMQEQGRHQLVFDGRNLSSGVYFYRIDVTDQAGVTRSRTRKLLLVR